MNLAIKIISQAFRLIMAEPARTLTVIAPGVAIIIVSMLLLPVSLGPEAGTSATSPSANVPLLFISVALAIFGWMVFAILYHRHVLLIGEARTGVMRPGSDVFLTYFKALIVIGLMVLAISILVGIGVGLVIAVAGDVGLLIILLVVVSVAVIPWILLRISLTLPAGALGRNMGFKDSWEATQPISKSIFYLALLLAVLNFVLSLIAGSIVAIAPTLSVIPQILISVLNGLFYVSVLSTLYGYLIEKRDLS